MFAGESMDANSNSSLKAEMINDHTMRFSENGVVETVEVRENQVIYNNQKTGEKIVLTVDGNRVHSSATGETIVVTDEEAEELIDMISSDTHPQSTTKMFSYAKIKSALGGTATIAAIAGAIVGLLSAAGYSAPEMLPEILELVKGISGLAALIMNGSSDHGIKVTLKEKKRRAVRQGKEYYVWVWSVTGISKY